MKYERTINALFISSAFYLMLALFASLADTETEKRQIFTPRDFGSAPRVEHKRATPTPTPTPRAELIEADKLRETAQAIPITYTARELDYIGEYFITSYCPAECGGSWQTSSGETCHYSDDPNEPTTCAIDRSIHSYYELIAVEFEDELKIYITEDTGPGVRGRWLDAFVETMSEVNAWPTGYKSVYSVSYTTTTKEKDRRRFYDTFTHYLLDRRGGGRTGCGDDRRAEHRLGDDQSAQR